MITAKKSFGQNFLKDSNVINNIVSSVDVNPDDLIIEIGPGQGALTTRLKEKNAQVIAFEIDERMHEVLDKLEDDRTRIIYEDILKVDLSSILKEYNHKKLYVIANLPYYITTPIIENLITLDIKIDALIVMVQKEVADRFSATPGNKEYGLMTVLINSKYNVKKLFNVKNTCFIPAPKVDSAVVKMTLRNDVEEFDFNKLKKLLVCSFQHKRKTLKNNLSKEYWEVAQKVLFENDVDLNSRPENISTDLYIDICNKL
ncbi:MAG: 16S rRNA (adenine(1518)-N(6)/adenine(1519)-N(6))-dimethyltransferase RsmA [Bacilli bacterium]|nr:16S rRNA (adenine(1518)-N(6)/adenine(1519)-N(6))-dimethyltransferase RsmA [Bacilli bacterium]